VTFGFHSSESNSLLEPLAGMPLTPRALAVALIGDAPGIWNSGADRVKPATSYLDEVGVVDAGGAEMVT
jgi:hypothetical protein